MRFSQHVTVVILCLLALQASTQAENVTQKSEQPRGRIDDVVRYERLPDYILNKDTSEKSREAPAAVFPEYLRGTWKGSLKTMWSATAPDMDFISQCKVGNTGDVEFIFNKVQSGVSMEPTSILFPAEMKEYDAVLLDKQGWTEGKPSKVRKEWKTNGGKVGISPMLSIGTQNTTTATGKKIETFYVYNVAKELKRGTVEQDMVTKQFFDGSFECYRESVIRFTWYSVNRVYCQIGFGEYNQDGSYKRKILLQGWLTRAS